MLAEVGCERDHNGIENVPVGLTNSVPTFFIVDGRKVKRSMDECVRMSEVDKFPKGKEFVTILSIMS